MLVLNNSELSGKKQLMEINVTGDQIREYLNGKPIKDAMPDLTSDEVVFIISGIHPEEWADYLSNE